MVTIDVAQITKMSTFYTYYSVIIYSPTYSKTIRFLFIFDKHMKIFLDKTFIKENSVLHWKSTQPNLDTSLSL